MPSEPGVTLHCSARVVPYRDSLVNLQPAKERMNVWRASPVSPRFTGMLDFTKPAKKQKQVAGTDSLIFQMCLRSCSLPKCRAPSWRSRYR
jgi:hypothetical protein